MLIQKLSKHVSRITKFGLENTVFQMETHELVKFLIKQIVCDLSKCAKLHLNKLMGHHGTYPVQ